MGEILSRVVALCALSALAGELSASSPLRLICGLAAAGAVAGLLETLMGML